ncbi:MAG: CARDB domain-containing protein [Nanoarchaeota archaeon]
MVEGDFKIKKLIRILHFFILFGAISIIFLVDFGFFQQKINLINIQELPPSNLEGQEIESKAEQLAQTDFSLLEIASNEHKVKSKIMPSLISSLSITTTGETIQETKEIIPNFNKIELNMGEETEILPNSEVNTSKSLNDSINTVQSKSLQSKTITNSNIIHFSSFPSGTLCNNYNEYLNFSLDLGTVNLNLGLSAWTSCQLGLSSNNRWDISMEYNLMEDDGLLGAEEISYGSASATTYDCATLNLENFRGSIVKRKFDNINLKYEFNDELLEGDTIEIFATISSLNNYFSEYKTSNLNIVGDSCDCISGSCCGTTRPFKYKLSGSQPIGKTDSYFCSGTNYVVKRDYYCTGSSSTSTYSDSNVDTCGTCEYCTADDSTCNPYGTSEVCGSKDCSSLNTVCKDYSNVNKYCNGAGSCGSGGTCSDYTNKPSGTICGINQKCNTIGTCISCTSHAQTKCYDNDVYYFNLCGDLEDKKSECGLNTISSWSEYCEGDDIYKKRIYYDKGCLNGACYSESGSEIEKVQSCTYGCETISSSTRCKTNSNIKCNFNSDCGSNGESSPYCGGNKVYTWATYYTCNNPETAQSSCSSDSFEILKADCNYGCYNGICNPTGCSKDTDCGESYCDDWQSNYCKNGDVYHKRNCYNKICSSYICSENLNIDEQRVIDCTTGCQNDLCEKPDLIIGDLVIQKKEGKKVTLAFTIGNNGNASANPVYWMVDTNSVDENLKRTSAITLNYKDATRAYMMINYSNSGTYHPKVIVDFNNLINETNEANNEASISVTV